MGRAVNPPRHQILRIEKEGMTDDFIYSSYLATLLLKLQWHTRINDGTFLVNGSANNAKYLKFYGWKGTGKSSRLSGRYQTLIWRPGGTVQNLESPGLSGRVDSTVWSMTMGLGEWIRSQWIITFPCKKNLVQILLLYSRLHLSVHT